MKMKRILLPEICRYIIRLPYVLLKVQCRVFLRGAVVRFAQAF